MAEIQANPSLVNKIQTFKEINLDFLVIESNLYQFDQPEALSQLYGSLADPAYPATIARKLSNVCITLNEHPSIRYQGNSKYAREIGITLDSILKDFKRINPTFYVQGDDNHHDRDRAQILIVDRSFDPLSPLMHEYTYQAMVEDLLYIKDGIISYKTKTNKGTDLIKEAILNDNDELWLELRHSHIAKVIETIKDRMNDIIQNNAGAALAKKSGANMNITSMAAAVKELPEYQQTMNKLAQHVAIAQQCMDAFSKLGLLELSQVEQTVSTGVDEDGKEVKGAKLTQLVLDTLRSATITKDQKTRLLIIYILAQRSATSEERRQLIQAAGLSGSEQQVLLNFDRLAIVAATSSTTTSSTTAPKSGGFLSLFRRTPVKHEATPEGEYADTRHVPQLKILLEKLIQGELPIDLYPTYGPATPIKDAKAAAKSVRRFGGNSRWGNTKADVSYDGGRYLVFVAGGISYAEVRGGYELMTQYKKEVIIGSTNVISPPEYINVVSFLDSAVSKTGEGELI